MREILFKAKRKDNGKWVEGIPIKTNIGYFMCYDENPHYCSLYGYIEIDDIVMIDENTLCQYTGLTDKNGKRIWENDIVECGMKLRVSWHHFKASWVLSKKGWMYNHFFGEAVEPEDVEVIGNVFDNADSLEVE